MYCVVVDLLERIHFVNLSNYSSSFIKKLNLCVCNNDFSSLKVFYDPNDCLDQFVGYNLSFRNVTDLSQDINICGVYKVALFDDNTLSELYNWGFYEYL